MNSSKFSSPSPRLWCCLVLTLIAFAMIASVPASAQVNGALFTTDPAGATVDGNIYPDAYCKANSIDGKHCVYISGGAHNLNASGLVPANTLYYFQVTDPSGAVLLSQDNIKCRVVVVDSAGRVQGVPADDGTSVGLPGKGTPGCYHSTGTADANGGLPVQLCSNGLPCDSPNSYANTPNPGGEYKAWLTPVADYNETCPPGHASFGFCDKDSKTDNFKVKNPGSADVTVCKFNDVNGTGTFDQANDPLIPGWPVTAYGVDGDTGSGVSVNTDQDGCAAFTVSTFNTGGTSVTIVEGTQGGAEQTYPPNGDCTNAKNNATISNCSVTGASPLLDFEGNNVSSGGQYNLTVNSGDSISGLYFGNTFPPSPPVVSKTAATSLTRTFNWTITKCAADPGSTTCVSNPPAVDQLSGTATFSYTVVVGQNTSNLTTDSNWMVTGSISIGNVNSFDLTGVSVSDALPASNGTCTVSYSGSTASSLTVTVPALSTINVPYACSFTSTPNPYSGTTAATENTATVSGTFPDGTTTFTQVGQAPYDFNAATITYANQTVTVDDTYWTNLTIPAPVTVQLGTCGPATLTSPYASCTFNYTRTITVTPGCHLYDNTATIVETSQTANAEVELCGPASTGALTMGFWQNKNGQGIITGGGSISGVCKSGTWLRQYPPFQDLSSTASCAQVATYVYNVIKAATCSTSGTCNAMLKAQMLATALDVYFSDPLLGGNKIGAYNGKGNSQTPIGAQKIDLTKVCSMIDGTGGTATCSGTLLNCSSAFGGTPTCQTVLQLLAYAGSQSNVGGGIWYANVKATQVLAKNVFDAINNQVAFNCP